MWWLEQKSTNLNLVTEEAIINWTICSMPKKIWITETLSWWQDFFVSENYRLLHIKHISPYNCKGKTLRNLLIFVHTGGNWSISSKDSPSSKRKEGNPESKISFETCKEAISSKALNRWNLLPVYASTWWIRVTYPNLIFN